MNFDAILVVTMLVSGVLCGYFSLMRTDAPPPKRKIIYVFRDIFLMALTILALRLMFLVFPTIQPDDFFLGITLIAGFLYAITLIAKHGSEDRKMVVFWRDMFLCFFVVFIFRGFFFDYFRIPSKSMLPTLMTGDVVLTDKNAYGYRLPVFDATLPLSAGDAPQRGEVIVFRKPGDEIFYIKRIVGTPGDVVRYGSDKKLYINGNPLPRRPVEETFDGRQRWQEQTPAGGWYDIYIGDRGSLLYQPPNAEHCQLFRDASGDSLTCEIPPEHYFVLGDNRDHSNDSRFWGFVPRQNIVGSAFQVLFNYNHFNRFWHTLRLNKE